MLHAALSRGESERAAFLGHACAGDVALRREVELLLAQQASMGGFLEDPAVATAAQMVSETGASVLTGRRLGAYQVQARSASAAWARSIARATRSQARRGDQDSAARTLRAIPIGWRGSNARRACSRRSIIPTSARSTGWKTRMACARWCSSWSRARRWPTGSRAAPIPVTDTLSIARQIADALDAAHERGIVHRDLKPANIKITPDGVVKVLDFGLAKATAGDRPGPDLTQSPTMTVGGTQEGVILGTPAYMSPEQARGQTVDKRTDIWAFGCVLYEMLAGRPAFARETITDTLAAVVGGDTDWKRLPMDTPPVSARCCGAVSTEIRGAGCGTLVRRDSSSTKPSRPDRTLPLFPSPTRAADVTRGIRLR